MSTPHNREPPAGPRRGGWITSIQSTANTATLATSVKNHPRECVKDPPGHSVAHDKSEWIWQVIAKSFDFSPLDCLRDDHCSDDYRDAHRKCSNSCTDCPKDKTDHDCCNDAKQKFPGKPNGNDK